MMRLKFILVLSLIFLIFNLSGCGFRLRGTGPHPYQLPFNTVMIAPDDPFDCVYKQLRHSLQAKKIKVISKSTDYMTDTALCDSIPRIIILSQTLTERPFAYGPDGETRRETLVFELKYQYHYYDQNQIKTRQATMVTRRFRQINLNQNLADLAEKEIIKKEMILDVVQQLLVQLTI